MANKGKIDNSFDILSGGGRAGALMRAINWDATSIGPVALWPSSLKNSVRLALDNGSPVYIAWGEEYTQFYNDSYLPILGENKFMSHMGQNTKHPLSEFWPHIEPMWEEVKSGESRFYEDIGLQLNKQGSQKQLFFSFSPSPLRDDSGKIVGIIVIANETTERVLSEQRLQDEREMLYLIADRLPAFVSYIGSDGKYKFANSAYSNWTGIPRSKIEGIDRNEVIHDQGTAEYIETHRQRALKGERVHYELTLSKPTGECVTLDAEYLPDVDLDTKKIKGILCVGLDITERKRALMEAERAQKELREIFMQAPLPMAIMTGPKHVFTLANPSYLRFVRRDLINKEVLDVFNLSEVENILPILDKVYREGESVLVRETLVKIPDDNGMLQDYFLNIGYHPYKDSRGFNIGVMTIIYNVTDQVLARKRIEEAKAIAENANATKSSFLANMSHEIRTPLGAMLGFSELLKNSNLAAGLRDQYIETISRSGQSLARIIDDILDLAKVEAGRLEVEYIDFSLLNLLNEAIELLKEKANQKGISLALTIDPNVPQDIYSDPTRLRQIFINIIGNAVKFTDVGSVSVHVESLQRNDGTLQFSISVTDTGCGLNEEQKNRLFEPFTQADNTTTRQYGGTGLGLALSKRLSEVLGGTISIDQYEKNKGCTFVISFVAMIGKASLEKKENVSEFLYPSKNYPLKGMKILFADDSPDNQFLVEHFLTINGAEVSLANDGREAVDKALEGFYDLVLMDIQMPVMDGHQAAKILMNKGYKVPIIALTAHAMAEEREKTCSSGFSGHLTKPFNFNELLQTVACHGANLNHNCG